MNDPIWPGFYIREFIHVHLICMFQEDLIKTERVVQKTKSNRLFQQSWNVLFVLRFYGPVNPMGSCRVRSVYLTTRLLGRLSPLSGSPELCTFFRQKLTTALLESVEGREWSLKIFHDQSPRKNVADLGWGWTRDLLVSSRTGSWNVTLKINHFSSVTFLSLCEHRIQLMAVWHDIAQFLSL